MSRNFISINDIDDHELDLLTRPGFGNKPDAAMMTGTMALLFEQASLRTMSSFAAAGINLGLTPIAPTIRGHAVRDRVDFRDEVTQLSLIAKCVVTRSAHPLGALEPRAGTAPVINGGDGCNEHPSQALLDITTMRMLASLDNKCIALMGNLQHRVHHSLVMGLERLGVKVRLVSPPQMTMDHVYTSFNTQVLTVNSSSEVDEALCDVDYVYLTPLGHWTSTDQDTNGVFAMNHDRAHRVLKPSARILHPFPRLEELNCDLDGSRYDAYHLQTSLGPAVRQRLLSFMLQGR